MRRAISKLFKTGKPVLLHVRVVEAKNLVAGDVNGLSDPFAIVKVDKGSKKFETGVKWGTLNPVWDEGFTFNVTAESLPQSHLQLVIMDKDIIKSSDFLGMASFPLRQLKEKNPQLLWLPLLDKQGVRSVPGQVLVHVGFQEAIPPEKEIETSMWKFLTLTEGKDEKKEENPGLVKVYTGSWNCGNAPPPENLTPWLDVLDTEYDLVAIGTQECSYPHRKGFKDLHDDWISTLRGAIGGKYLLVKEEGLLEMKLSVWVNRTKAELVSQVDVAREATGIAHVVGNKGGVAISLIFGDTKLCFVSAHLAAHQTKCELRNANYKEIVDGLILDKFPQAGLVNQFHHVFWMGDLNYRVNYGPAAKENTPDEKAFGEVVDMVNKGDTAPLWEHDQLVHERNEGHAFPDWSEGEVAKAYPPTFKVERAAGMKYNPKRLPAWCDRVMWKSMEGQKLRQTKLGCAKDVGTSDHKPVFAAFELPMVSLPCSVDDNLGYAKLSLRKVKGENLAKADVGSSSDPFFIVSGPAFLTDGHSKVKSNTQNPVWEDSEVPELVLWANAKSRILQTYAYLTLYDKDPLSSDHLGGAVVSLHEAAAKLGEWVPFKTTVYLHGLRSGIMSGECRLSYDPPLTPEQKKKMVAEEKAQKKLKAEEAKKLAAVRQNTLPKPKPKPAQPAPAPAPAKDEKKKDDVPPASPRTEFDDQSYSLCTTEDLPPP